MQTWEKGEFCQSALQQILWNHGNKSWFVFEVLRRRSYQVDIMALKEKSENKNKTFNSLKNISNQQQKMIWKLFFWSKWNTLLRDNKYFEVHNCKMCEWNLTTPCNLSNKYAFCQNLSGDIQKRLMTCDSWFLWLYNLFLTQQKNNSQSRDDYRHRQPDNRLPIVD